MPVITTVLAAGLLSARPTASASNAGFYFVATDVSGGTLFQSTGSAWVQIAAAVTQTAAGVGAVANAGGAPSLQIGLDASKPAAGTAGRVYVSTDIPAIYEDSGSAWVLMATAAWATITGKPTTFTPSAHESTHLAAGGDAIVREGLLPQVASSVESLVSDPASPADGRTWLNTAVGAIKARIAGVTEIINDWNALRNKPSTFTPATHTHPESDVTSLATDLTARVQLSPGSQQTGAINVSGEVQGSDFKPGGVTGASAAARYHAATASGHPTTGTWNVGDIVPDQTGTFWFCTVAGTPGTWVQVGGTGGGGGSSTLAGDTDVAIASPVGGQVLGYNGSTAKWVNQNVAGVGATTQTAQLGADVTMTSANTFYDGPSITLAPGTWLLIGSVTAYAAAAPTHITAKLWDGSTVYASSEQTTGASAYKADPTVTAIVTPTSTTSYKISVAADASNATISAAAPNNGAGNNASYLRAIQLSGNPVGQLAPAVRAHSSAAQSTTSGSVTLLTWDTNDTDQGTSTAQHSTSSNTGRLVCQQAGMYVATLWAEFATNATGERMAKIQLNGAGTNSGTDMANTRVNADATASSPTELVCTTPPVHLGVGDYLEAYALQSSGGALNVNGGAGSSQFGMARIDSGPGAPTFQWKTVTTTYSIATLDTGILADATSAAFTVTLPTAVGSYAQYVIKKKDSSANRVTVATTSSQTIDGNTTFVIISQNESITVASDNSNWYIL